MLWTSLKLVQNQFRTGLQLGNLLGEIFQKIWGNFQVFGIDLLDICGFWEDFGKILLSQSGNTELINQDIDQESGSINDNPFS